MNRKVYLSDFGITGNGETMCTTAFQRAIDILENGDELYISSGEYTVGTLFLHSNTRIFLEKGAVVKGSTDIADYKKREYCGCMEAPSFSECLIYAEKCENISICGEGQILGSGNHFSSGQRPMLIRFAECKNIAIRDISLGSSGSWCCNLLLCEDVKIDGVKLENRVNPNNDGLDFDSCQRVWVSNSHISTNDDCICMKSSTKKPCEDIIIDKCILESDTAAVKTGTASMGGFKNVLISNCIMKNCSMGVIKLIETDGGVLENVNINNIIMENVGSPLFIRTGRRNLTFDTPKELDFYGEGCENDKKSGKIENIIFSNITASVTVKERDRNSIFISGVSDSYVKNIVISDVNIIFPGGGTKNERNIAVLEDEYKYPEQWFFGVTPSYGIYARYVDGFFVRNAVFHTKTADEREAVVMKGCGMNRRVEITEIGQK